MHSGFEFNSSSNPKDVNTEQFLLEENTTSEIHLHSILKERTLSEDNLEQLLDELTPNNSPTRLDELISDNSPTRPKLKRTDSNLTTTSTHTFNSGTTSAYQIQQIEEESYDISIWELKLDNITLEKLKEEGFKKNFESLIAYTTSGNPLYYQLLKRVIENIKAPYAAKKAAEDAKKNNKTDEEAVKAAQEAEAAEINKITDAILEEFKESFTMEVVLGLMILFKKALLDKKVSHGGPGKSNTDKATAESFFDKLVVYLMKKDPGTLLLVKKILALRLIDLRRNILRAHVEGKSILDPSILDALIENAKAFPETTAEQNHPAFRKMTPTGIRELCRMLFRLCSMLDDPNSPKIEHTVFFEDGTKLEIEASLQALALLYSILNSVNLEQALDAAQLEYLKKIQEFDGKPESFLEHIAPSCFSNSGLKKDLEKLTFDFSMLLAPAERLEKIFIEKNSKAQAKAENSQKAKTKVEAQAKALAIYTEAKERVPEKLFSIISKDIAFIAEKTLPPNNDLQYKPEPKLISLLREILEGKGAQAHLSEIYSAHKKFDIYLIAEKVRPYLAPGAALHTFVTEIAKIVKTNNDIEIIINALDKQKYTLLDEIENKEFGKILKENLEKGKITGEQRIRIVKCLEKREFYVLKRITKDNELNIQLFQTTEDQYASLADEDLSKIISSLLDMNLSKLKKLKNPIIGNSLYTFLHDDLDLPQHLKLPGVVEVITSLLSKGIKLTPNSLVRLLFEKVLKNQPMPRAQDLPAMVNGMFELPDSDLVGNLLEGFEDIFKVISSLSQAFNDPKNPLSTELAKCLTSGKYWLSALEIIEEKLNQKFNHIQTSKADKKIIKKILKQVIKIKEQCKKFQSSLANLLQSTNFLKTFKEEWEKNETFRELWQDVYSRNSNNENQFAFLMHCMLGFKNKILNEKQVKDAGDETGPLIKIALTETTAAAIEQMTASHKSKIKVNKNIIDPKQRFTQEMHNLGANEKFMSHTGKKEGYSTHLRESALGMIFGVPEKRDDSYVEFLETLQPNYLPDEASSMSSEGELVLNPSKIRTQTSNIKDPINVALKSVIYNRLPPEQALFMGLPLAAHTRDPILAYNVMLNFIQKNDKGYSIIASLEDIFLGLRTEAGFDISQLAFLNKKDLKLNLKRLENAGPFDISIFTACTGHNPIVKQCEYGNYQTASELVKLCESKQQLLPIIGAIKQLAFTVKNQEFRNILNKAFEGALKEAYEVAIDNLLKSANGSPYKILSKALVLALEVKHIEKINQCILELFKCSASIPILSSIAEAFQQSSPPAPMDEVGEANEYAISIQTAYGNNPLPIAFQNPNKWTFINLITVCKGTKQIYPILDALMKEPELIKERVVQEAIKELDLSETLQSRKFLPDCSKNKKLSALEQLPYALKYAAWFKNGEIALQALQNFSKNYSKKDLVDQLINSFKYVNLEGLSSFSNGLELPPIKALSLEKLQKLLKTVSIIELSIMAARGRNLLEEAYDGGEGDVVKVEAIIEHCQKTRQIIPLLAMTQSMAQFGKDSDFTKKINQTVSDMWPKEIFEGWKKKAGITEESPAGEDSLSGDLALKFSRLFSGEDPLLASTLKAFEGHEKELTEYLKKKFDPNISEQTFKQLKVFLLNLKKIVEKSNLAVSTVIARTILTELKMYVINNPGVLPRKGIKLTIPPTLNRERCNDIFDQLSVPDMEEIFKDILQGTYHYERLETLIMFYSDNAEEVSKRLIKELAVCTASEYPKNERKQLVKMLQQLAIFAEAEYERLKAFIMFYETRIPEMSQLFVKELDADDLPEEQQQQLGSMLQQLDTLMKTKNAKLSQKIFLKVQEFIEEQPEMFSAELNSDIPTIFAAAAKSQREQLGSMLQQLAIFVEEIKGQKERLGSMLQQLAIFVKDENVKIPQKIFLTMQEFIETNLVMSQEFMKANLKVVNNKQLQEQLVRVLQQLATFMEGKNAKLPQKLTTQEVIKANLDMLEEFIKVNFSGIYHVEDSAAATTFEKEALPEFQETTTIHVGSSIPHDPNNNGPTFFGKIEVNVSVASSTHATLPVVDRGEVAFFTNVQVTPASKVGSQQNALPIPENEPMFGLG